VQAREGRIGRARIWRKKRKKEKIRRGRRKINKRRGGSGKMR
jgi:hypothetical protein